MGKEVLDKLLPALEKVDWPKNRAGTPLGMQVYETAIERIDAYHGDLKVLAGVLRLLQTADSQPYAFAAAAYMLVVASAEKDGSYAPEGLEAAMTWLEKAQEGAPDVVEINMVEALVYIHNGRSNDARLVLDYLGEQEPNNYYLHLAEIAYWKSQNDTEQTIHWFNKAMQSTPALPRKAQMRHGLADYYADINMPDKALDMYKEIVKVEKENAWLWHKMSVLFMKKGSLQEAFKCNQRALQLQDTPVARQVEAILKKRMNQ